VSELSNINDLHEVRWQIKEAKPVSSRGCLVGSDLSARYLAGSYQGVPHGEAEKQTIF
jgi:hypothetical protein